MKTFILVALQLLSWGSLLAQNGQPALAPAPYQNWRYSGSIYLLTTPEGANLPASAAEQDFPLLVRLHQDFFDFRQAKPGGEDIRFSAGGKPLAYQVEEWAPAHGGASIWVRIPRITGNARQEIKLHWGQPDAASESKGSAVFNESNGYLSVWHMGGPVRDETGLLPSTDKETTATAGIIGPARRFGGGQGIYCGDKITNYPAGASPHSTELWFRSAQPNSTLVAWGNEQAQGKVVMQFRSPPHINLDCYFSDANVRGKSPLPAAQWTQVVHTYQKGEARVYVNGSLDGTAKNSGAPLAIKTPARLWIGGWYHNYNFVGDLDEVRISKVARSADWVKLQYENQKPLPTLAGPVVRPGNAFSVSPAAVTVREGKRATVSAEAGGAQKIYWILKRDQRETLVATDRLACDFEAGRVTGDAAATLQFKAIYADGVKTRDIPITIKEAIPEPAFTLGAPATWDGRTPIEVVPQIANSSAMAASGGGDLHYQWRVAGLAAIKEIAPGKLLLKRAQNSGKLTATLALSNGGAETVRSVTILVNEPKQDAWVQRKPEPEEKPEDNQFYARDDQGAGTLYCNGTLAEAADSVFLRVYADNQLVQDTSQKLLADKSYAFTLKLKPGLVKYRVEFGARTGDRRVVLHTATNLLCGDAYLINGQSNALATDTSEQSPAETSDWIRSYGSPRNYGKGGPSNLWCSPVWKAQKGELAELGYWGMELAKRLVNSQKIPICIINGAAGGTRIDQHQRNPANPADVATLYGRLLWRVRQAKLTHGVRGILWHQGENDQGADGPTGGFGWETYENYFIELAAAWKQDYPNLQHYYIFQIWPKACSMGVDGSDNRLREVQRNLPARYSNLHIMSTLGIQPPGGCHYPLTGWAEFARLIQPLIERDNYGKLFTDSITPPNLIRAAYTSGARDAIELAFDQPVKWDDALANQFYLDGENGRIASGTATGNLVALKLKAPASAQKLTYLDSKSWSQKTLLWGKNGLAALTFCEVPIQPAP